MEELSINDVKLVGKYVAIRGDEILGFSEDKGKLIEEMKRKGVDILSYSIVYIPARIRFEYINFYGNKVPIIDVKILCNRDNEMYNVKALLSPFFKNFVDRSLAEECYLKNKIHLSIGVVEREVEADIVDLSGYEFPILPELIISYTLFKNVCFYSEFVEITI
ncbi:hypothetical protein BFU36_03895 [Sulfolobus sp. A20]|uniref:DUF5678 domain-containing protein n=1 Tax=Saccharolobus sp. A20 TaxID=1891280 RepID=UPI0008461373|nr:DUF5678 domain-containing protein [Sulfolobus sp. A20]AOL16009.1 hypothetical protein BFU36_03895 [Sulfolobus sp. A20]